MKIRATLKKLRITLVGHSMGAIASNELLTAIPDLPIENIVYMAAASNIRDTEHAVSPVLQRNKGCTKFFNLMLHPLNDAREISFLNEEGIGRPFQGIAPAGSLLAWIDTYYADPETPQDRTMGRWDNLRAARDVFPAEARQWMAWRVFNRDPKAYGGYASNKDTDSNCKFEAPSSNERKPLRHPAKHGDFNCTDQKWWTRSFWTGETPADAMTDKPIVVKFRDKDEGVTCPWEKLDNSSAEPRTTAKAP